MKLEENLVRLRKEHGLSQNDLAEKLNVSRQAVSRWEQGAAMPSTDNLIYLSKLYGITLDELIHGENTQAILQAEEQNAESPNTENTPSDQPHLARRGFSGKRKLIALGLGVLVVGLIAFLIAFHSLPKKDDISSLEEWEHGVLDLSSAEAFSFQD